MTTTRCVAIIRLRHNASYKNDIYILTQIGRKANVDRGNSSQDVFDKKDFEWAFTLLEIMVSEITDELRKLTEGAFEQVQKR